MRTTRIQSQTSQTSGVGGLEHQFYFPINIKGCDYHPNWRTPSFFRGVFPLAHQPVFVLPVIFIPVCHEFGAHPTGPLPAGFQAHHPFQPLCQRGLGCLGSTQSDGRTWGGDGDGDGDGDLRKMLGGSNSYKNYLGIDMYDGGSKFWWGGHLCIFSMLALIACLRANENYCRGAKKTRWKGILARWSHDTGTISTQPAAGMCYSCFKIDSARLCQCFHPSFGDKFMILFGCGRTWGYRVCREHLQVSCGIRN